MPDSSTSQKKQTTILLVDDSERVRPVVRHILESEGWEVIEAQSPAQALLILSQGDREVDLMLTDFMMPGMTGIQLAQRVREQHPHIKLLCMSGYDVSPGGAASVEFIEKPFRPNQLIDKVRAMLER